MSKLTSTLTGVYIIFWSCLRLATTSLYCGNDFSDKTLHCPSGYHCCSTMRHTCCPDGTSCLGETRCITPGGIVGIIFGSLFGLAVLLSCLKCCCNACDPESSSSVHPN
ncbi:uncharacterized protein LOC128177995 [Crassostrea angulata]|uniref:uncharacterized protein LOC128177995 n=1 Tax=Magallana angulata TaxID=2784310 RepID=UPI0022B124EE|nr:uncharacterized protein LOC128177995 [Crassostrea angulata]